MKYVPEWFPGANFQREARTWKINVEKMRHAPFNEVQRQLVWLTFLDAIYRTNTLAQADGRVPECVATSLLDRMAKNAEDRTYMEDVIRSTLGSMYTGTDTFSTHS